MNASRNFNSPGYSISGSRVIGPDATQRITADELQYGSFLIRNSPVELVIEERQGMEQDERNTTIRTRPSVMNSDSNQQSNPSPDEIVIKGRGRRSLPLKWSPIPIESPQKTPLSSLMKRSPKKGVIALRSSPRKRLQLNDATSSELIQNRKHLLSSSPLTRRTNESDTESSQPSMSDLSKDQLEHVLKSIMKSHPQIKDEIGHLINSDNQDQHNPDVPSKMKDSASSTGKSQEI